MSTSDDKPASSGRSSIRINDPDDHDDAKRPDDFAALSDIHEGGVASRWSGAEVWGVAAFAFLLGGAAAVWWFGSSRSEAPVAPPSSGETLSQFDPRDPANKATIVVSVDAPCMLWVGGKPTVKLGAGESAELSVMPVEQQIICQSTAQPSVKASQIRKLDAKSRVFVALELAPGLAAAKAVPTATTDQPPAVSDYQERWTASGVGALRDSSTGLKWSQDDNGKDIDWKSAGKYCSTLDLGGTGWRLPSADELKAIYDASGPPKASCRVGKCGASTQMRLSSYLFWAADPNGEYEAWSVSLGGGQRASYPTIYSLDARALCVRGA